MRQHLGRYGVFSKDREESTRALFSPMTARRFAPQGGKTMKEKRIHTCGTIVLFGLTMLFLGLASTSNAISLGAAEAAGQIPRDRDFSNNVFHEAAVLPDLALSTFYAQAISPTTQVLTARVANIGTIPSGPFNVAVHIGSATGELLEIEGVDSLGSGDLHDLLFLWDTGAGSYSEAYETAHVTVDEDNLVEEADETNNRSFILVQVGQEEEPTATPTPPEAPTVTPTPTPTNPPPPEFVANIESIPVFENTDSYLYVGLSAEPESDVTGVVERVSGDEDLTVKSGSPFTITKSNWVTGAQVIFHAAEDVDETNGSAVFRIRDTSGSGVESKEVSLKEIDNDGLINVSGTISEDTTWSDTTHAYNISPNPVDIPAGVTLTLAPGVTVLNSGWNRDSFLVSGTLNAADGSFWLTTYVEGDGYRSNAIELKEGGVGDFRGCDFHVTEYSYRWSSNGAVYWSSAISAEDGSQLAVEGCSFESTNIYDRYRTTYGVHIGPASTVTISDDASGENPVATSFQGFRSGTGWKVGPNDPEIALDCTFADCDGMFVWGDVERDIALFPFRTRVEGNLTVADDATLTVPSGCSLYSTDLVADYGYLRVNSGGSAVANSASLELQRPIAVNGSFEANDCNFVFKTYASTTGYRANGMDFADGSAGQFRRCSLSGREWSWRSDWRTYTDWSAFVSAVGTSHLTFEGCAFESLVNTENNYRPTFCLKIEGTVDLAIRRDASGDNDILSSLKRFHYGVGWEYGPKTPEIAITTVFEDCRYEVTLPGGNLAQNLTVTTADVAFLDAATVKSGFMLTVPSGGGLIFPSTGYGLTVEAGGTLDLNGAGFVSYRDPQVSGTIHALDSTFEVYTYRWAGINGVKILDGGQGEFDGCSFFMTETDVTGAVADGAAGIYVAANGQLAVNDCFFTNFPIAYSGGSYYQYTRFAVRSLSTKSLRITHNHFSDNFVGLQTDAIPLTLEIEGNDFHNNSDYGVYNNAGTEVAALGNWWGSSAGPTHPTNPGGKGDRVSDKVNFANPLLSQPAAYVRFLDPVAGQEADNLKDSSDPYGVELAAFRVEPGPTTFSRVGFRLLNRLGMTDWSKVSNFRLAKDANGNGRIDTGEPGNIAGAARVANDRNDLIVKFTTPFASSPNTSVAYILLADFKGVAAGDGLTARVEHGLARITPGVGVESLATEAVHRSGDYLFLAGPAKGQERDNYSPAARQTDVELFGFRLLGAGKEVESIEFTLSNIQGLQKTGFDSARLVLDANANGNVDPTETTVGGKPEITVNGSSGYIKFTEAFSVSSSYILVADFSNLNGGDALTVGLNANKVAVKGDVEASGSVPTATHIVEDPYIIAISSNWDQPADFGVEADQLQVPVLGLRLLPLGRTVYSVAVQVSNLLGIDGSDISNAKIYWDKNESGRVDQGDEVLAVGTVSIQGTAGTISFSAPFDVPGDLIIAADFAGLADGDEITFSLETSDVEVPSGYVVTGSVPAIRYVVETGLEDGSGNKSKWTMAYRSPGGFEVTGRFNHAGNRLILGYDTGSAWIYDANSNTPLMMIKDHYDKVEYAGFSSDDSAAVTVTRDGAVYIWDLATGALRTAMFSDLLVTYGVPSPDFSKLMVITEGKGILLDVDSQQRLWEFVPGNATVNAIAYSPDGATILIGASDKNIYLLNSLTGVQIMKRTAHSQAVTAVGFTGDGTRMMSSSTDASVQIRRTTSPYEIVSSISLDQQQAQGAAVSYDGSRVALVSGTGNDAQLRMYDATVSPFLELYAINLNSVSTGNWGGKLRSISFNDEGDMVLVTSSREDWGNYWAPAAAFRTSDGSFIRYWGPRGYFSPLPDARPRVSEDGERVFYETKNGLNVVPRTPGKPILISPNLTYERGFDISADGSLVAWFDTNRNLRVDTVSDTGFSPFLSKFVDLNFNTITMAPSGRQIIAGSRRFSAQTGELINHYGGYLPEYRGAFSSDERYWGFAIGADKSLFTFETDDMNMNPTLYNIVDTGGGGTYQVTPYKMFYHPDGKRIGCVDNTHVQNRGVWMFINDINDPQVGDSVGIYRFQENTDAALSKDGSLLLIGGKNHVRLFDVRTGQILRYFYPQHSSLPDVWARSVQFADNDRLLMIAWDRNYIEMYARTRPVDLEITPLTRTLAQGESQAFRVEVVYDDTTRADVSPNIGSSADRAILEVEPPTAAQVAGNTVTVAAGASGTFKVIARYRESGINFSAEAVITAGESFVQELRADPAKMAVTPGVFRPIRYFARYNDGYETEVTDAVSLIADRPEDVVISQQSVKVNVTAMPGNIRVTGEYSDGTSQVSVDTIVTTFGPKTVWERYRITAGGYGLSGGFSNDGKKLAVGSSSGAVSIYNVGVTPSQYELENVIGAHDGQVRFAGYRSDGTLVTASDDGTIKVWDPAASGRDPLATFSHDAPILTAAAYGDRIAFGDNAGKVGVYNVVSDATEWVVAAHTGEVRTVDIYQDTVLSGGEDRRIKALQVSNGTETHVIDIHSGPIVAVGFMGYWRDKIFTVSEDKTAYILRKSDYEAISDFAYPAVPTSAAYVVDRLYVSTDDPVATWVYNEDGLLLSWLPHPPSEGRVSKILVDPSNQFLITGRSTTVKTVETEIGEMEIISPFSSFQFWEKGRSIYRGSLAHSFPLSDAHVTADASEIFTQDPKRTYAWSFGVDSATGTRLMETGYFITPRFAGMDFTGDSGTMATRVDTSIYLFDTINHLLWKTLHVPAPGPFAISANSGYLATSDQATRLWDLANLSLIKEIPHVSSALDFRQEAHFVGGIYGDKHFFVWKTSDGLPQTSAPTTYSPVAVFVNKAGTRCAIVTEDVQGDLLETIRFYYLEIFDLSDLVEGPTPVNQPLFLLQASMDIFGFGEDSVSFAIAVSEDTSLALVGPSGDRPVKLINVSDGSTIKEFLPPTGKSKLNLGAAAVGFTNEDRDAMIAWSEGYAEVHRRVQPTDLTVVLEMAGSAKADRPGVKSGYRKAMEDGDVLRVQPGDKYWVEAIANYMNGAELNVTSTVALSSDNEAAATVQGRTVSIPANAPNGSRAKLTAKYSELETQLETVITLQIGEAPSILGDTDGDGDVDINDLFYFSLWWGQTDDGSLKSLDMEDDGVINGKDLLIFIRRWGSRNGE